MCVCIIFFYFEPIIRVGWNRQYDFYQCFVVPYFGHTSLDDYFRVFLNTILSIILNILLHILFYSPPIFHYARTTQPVSLYVAGLPIHFIIHGSGSNFRIHVSGSSAPSKSESFVFPFYILGTDLIKYLIYYINSFVRLNFLTRIHIPWFLYGTWSRSVKILQNRTNCNFNLKIYSSGTLLFSFFLFLLCFSSCADVQKIYSINIQS